MNRAKSRYRRGSWSRPLSLLLSGMLLLPLLCGCTAFGGGPGPRVPEYSLGFYNATGRELTGVHVTWVADGVPYRVGAGILIPTAKAVSHFAPDPIPPRVTVWWRTPDGEDGEDGEGHSREVEVASKVPDLRSFTGTVWFKFTADGVEVVPMSEAEKLERAKQRRRVVPD